MLRYLPSARIHQIILAVGFEGTHELIGDVRHAPRIAAFPTKAIHDRGRNLFQTGVRGQFSQPGLASDELTGLDQVVERELDDIDSAGHARGYHTRRTESE